jgi:YegS/Rv2252/BmrU family lipid kinase
MARKTTRTRAHGSTPTSVGRVKVLINPESAGGAPRFRQRLGAALDALPIHSYQIAMPPGPAAMEQSARACAREHYDLVVAVGGDGTLNLVVNGLANSDTALAIVPLGTANVFARQLAVPREVERACALITEGVWQTIDLGRAGSRYFGCTSGIGFDAQVLKDVDTRLKKVSGYMAYLASALRGFIQYRFRRVYLRLDDDPRVYKGYMALVNNGQFYGGNFRFAPRARMTDGLLDVVIFPRHGVAAVARYLARIAGGTLDVDPEVIYARARRVHVEAHGHHAVHLDGEYVGRTPLEFKVVPQALKVVADPGAVF